MLHAAQRNGWNKDLSMKTKLHCSGERSLSGPANSRFCGSASLKLNAFNFFFGEASRAGLLQRRLDGLWPLHRRFDLDRRVLHAAQDSVLLLGGKPHEFYTELGPAVLLSISLTPSKYLPRSISICCFHASARLPSSLNQHKMKPLRPRAILGGGDLVYSTKHF